MSRFRIRIFPRFYKSASGSRWRFTTSGRSVLLALLISGIIGLNTRQNLSFQVFSVLAAFSLIAMLVFFRQRHHYSIRRMLPTLATMGQVFNYRVLVCNHTDRDLGKVLVVDVLEWNFPTTEEFSHYNDARSDSENIFDRIVGYPRWLRLADVKIGAKDSSQTLNILFANQTKALNFQLTPLRRGYLYFYGFKLGPSDILGLFRRFQCVQCQDKLLVLPKRYPVPVLSLKGRSQYNQQGVAQASKVGETGEFHGLRDYRAGDPLRNIHWRSLARLGSPLVKTFEQAYFVRHALVLDTYALNIPSQIFEEAVSVAASLALHIDDQESLLDLMFIERKRFHLTAGRHIDSVHTFLEVLACVEAQYHNSILELSQLVMEHSNLLSNIVCIFLRWDIQRMDMVRTLRQQGINVIVLLICDKLPNDYNEKKELIEQVFYLEAIDIESGLKKLSQLSSVNN